MVTWLGNPRTIAEYFNGNSSKYSFEIPRLLLLVDFPAMELTTEISKK
jgi:hypothetical protein